MILSSSPNNKDPSLSLKEAITLLRNSEKFIDSCFQANEKVPSELVLTVIANLGTCFYKAGLFDEAYSCFESANCRLKRSFLKKGDQAENKKNSGIENKKQ